MLGIVGAAHATFVHDATIPRPVPPYNPYPAGILPSDLDSEIARVQREVQFVFNEALTESAALPSPSLTGNPPTLQGGGYEAVEILGKLMNFDLNMSPFRNEGCGFCHMPYAAFSGPIPSVNLTMVAYLGCGQCFTLLRQMARHCVGFR
jgi:cytochrome c peroxidase